MPGSPELNPILPQESAIEQKEEQRPEVLEGGTNEIDPRQVIDLLSVMYDKSKEFTLAEKAKIEEAIKADKTQAYSEKMGARYNEINYKILPELDAKIAEVRAMADESDNADWENAEWQAKISAAKEQIETQKALNEKQEKEWEEAEWEAREYAELRAQAEARAEIEKASKLDKAA